MPASPAVLAYLTAAKPTGASYVCLIVALVLFVLAIFEPVFWTGRRQFLALIPAGLAFVTLAFLIN